MNRNLLLDFTVDKENKTIHIKREFNAKLELVWQAWTVPELLEQWWAPKPYRIEIKTLDLKVGGIWLYAMVSPKDEKMWCKADYKAIEVNKLLSWLDTFSDENGNENTIKPRSFWTSDFTEVQGVTTVSISLKHEKFEDIETMIEMGVKEGLIKAISNLDSLISKIKQENEKR